MVRRKLKIIKRLEEFYNDFVLASYCKKDLELFKTKFKEYFESTLSQKFEKERKKPVLKSKKGGGRGYGYRSQEETTS